MQSKAMGVSAAILLLWWGASASASPTVEDLAGDLASGVPARATKAARILAGMSGSKDAADVLMEALLLGAPPNLAVEYVRGLAKLADPRAFDILAHEASNRNDRVRAEAMSALGALGVASKSLSRRVFRLAVQGLRDGAAQVRTASARVLARLKNSGVSRAALAEAERTLQELLLKRRDQRSAKVGLGALGGASTARFLAVHMKELPRPVVIALFARFLKRKDFGPEPVRYWVVRNLASVNSPEAITALMSYVAAHQGEARRPSVLLAREIAER